MSYTTAGISTWLLGCADRMIASAPELNELDAALGDGDLGATLKNCAELIKVCLENPAEQPADLFKSCAMACTRASGSSFGTLMAVAFMTLAKETAGKLEMPVADIAPLIGKVNDSLMVRGRSTLGDKTALDSLETIRKAVQEVRDQENLHRAATRAASEAIEAFRMQPNKIGRARMFADKSIGLPDPGMVAVARIIGP
jgi:dihydroxyacetone kinase-like protein